MDVLSNKFQASQAQLEPILEPYGWLLVVAVSVEWLSWLSALSALSYISAYIKHLS